MKITPLGAWNKKQSRNVHARNKISAAYFADKILFPSQGHGSEETKLE